MRRDAVLKILAVGAFLAAALDTLVLPEIFVGAPLQAGRGIVSLLVVVLASACAAKVSVPLTLFGLHGRLVAPLLTLFAAAYSVRFLLRDPIVRGWVQRFRGAPEEPPPSPSVPVYALPARVAVALAAAARARK